MAGQGTFGEDLFLQLDVRFDLARTRFWQCFRCAYMADKMIRSR